MPTGAQTPQKAAYARAHLVHAGKLYEPGERLTGRMPDYAIASAIEHGAATDVATGVDELAAAEQERKEKVKDQIATRSEKRVHNDG